MLIIRKATIADAATIAQLGRTTFDETFADVFPIRQELDDYLARTFSTEKIESSLAKPNNVFWVAFWNEQPVGFAKFKVSSWYDDLDTEGVSQLQKIYVLKDFLDKKIGLELLQVVENEALVRGSRELWLVVLHSNARAIRFYEKAGFEKVKKHFYNIGSQRFVFELMNKKYT
jgi:diamine N-acetyltransferase